YPSELLSAMAEADRQAARPKAAADSEPDVVANLSAIGTSNLNFSYAVNGPEVPWRPIRAFDDGMHVFIQMPDTMKSSEAPALLIAAPGGNQMVNYRVRGDYYVVDRLFDRAALVAGVGRQQDRVDVAYTGGPR